MKKVLFIDRDGTLLEEPKDEQVDSLEKVVFVPGMIGALRRICERNDYRLVMVTNQDGLGTEHYPEESFRSVQNLLLNTLKGEGVEFDEVLVDRHYEWEGSEDRKPGTGMLKKYMTGEYDMEKSYVIGDRESDAELARNLGCRWFLIGKETGWDKAEEVISVGERAAEVHRRTTETDVYVRLDPDRAGKVEIDTGLPFFDHMLKQLGVHGGMSLVIRVKGDTEVDEHHTIEDTGLGLGECLRRCLGDKLGIERYGFCLPMDESICRVALDFGGRPWLEWDAEFSRDTIGGIGTEMFYHFFKSMCDAGLMNMNIWARGRNDHHCIEAVFKGVARALRMGMRRDVSHPVLPSSKGSL